MKKVNIVENKPKDDSVMLTKKEILDMLSQQNGTYRVLSSFELPESFIMENHEHFDPTALLMSNQSLSEEFVSKSLDIGFLKPSDLRDLNMQTYAGLSAGFLKKWNSEIGWNKIILYISTQRDDFEKYEDIIDQNNLWNMISSNDLPIDFIFKWREKLDWKQLSMVKHFSDIEREALKEYIWSAEDYSPIDINTGIEFDVDTFDGIFRNMQSNNQN